MALLTAAQSKLIIASRKIQGHSGRIGGSARSDSAQNVLIIDKINAAGSGQTTLTQTTRRVFVGFCPPTASDYANAVIGDKYLEFTTDATNGLVDYHEYSFGISGWVAVDGIAKIVTDPGDAAAIPVSNAHASIAITTAAAETNTLAIPTIQGQTLSLFVDTYAVGDRVITVASAINQAGNNTITLGAAADFIKLEAVTLAGALAWQVVANDGAALSTV